MTSTAAVNPPGIISLSPAELVVFNQKHPRELPARLFAANRRSARSRDISVDPAVEVDAFNYPEYTNNQEYDGLMANNTVYGGLSIPYGTHGNNVENELFAPTMKAPRSCLEVSTEYYNGEQYFTVFDFCNGSAGKYVVVLQTNSTFFNTYVRNLDGSTLPQYSVYNTSFHPGIVTACSGSKTVECDVAALYNYNTSQWVVQFARVEGNTQGYTQGWDQIETHYPANYCPTIPVISSSNIQEWQYSIEGYITPTPANSSDGSSIQPNTCFNGTYVFNNLSPNSDWQSYSNN